MVRYWKKPRTWVDKARGEENFHVDLELERGDLLLLRLFDSTDRVVPVDLLRLGGGKKIHVKITWEKA